MKSYILLILNISIKLKNYVPIKKETAYTDKEYATGNGFWKLFLQG